jgi:hypothetical protein
MLDPTTIRLNETLYNERLQAAAQARQRRASWVAAPHLIDRLRSALARQLIAVAQHLQPRAPTRRVKA